MIRSTLRWFAGGLGLAVAVGLGLAAWRLWTDHRALDRQFVKQTVSAMKEWPAVVDSLQRSNDSLLRLIANKRKAAAVNKQRHDSILTVHPIALAPAACQPWLDALESCGREADSLRSALDLADTLHQRDSLALRRATNLIGRGVTAVNVARHRCWLGLPCPGTFAEVDYGLRDARMELRAGLMLHGEQIQPSVDINPRGEIRARVRVLF